MKPLNRLRESKARKRIAYSQNFLTDGRLIAELIDKSSITNIDVVIEIGAGHGIVTQELVIRSKKVIALEIDKNLYDKLSQRFQSIKNLELKLGDFLSYQLPSFQYKVFSSIPYNITSAIIKKITVAKNPPIDAYLVVQKEAAKKFVGKPYDNKNTQAAILLRASFQLEILHQLNRSDFHPRPRVDSVLLRIKKLENPYVAPESRKSFEDLVVYTFNQTKPNVVEGLGGVIGKQNMLMLAGKFGFPPTSKPSELEFEHWLAIFSYFNNIDTRHKAIVSGASEKLHRQEQKLEKIHRTRIDKSWKKYRRSN